MHHSSDQDHRKKPDEKSWNDWVEEKIHEAQAKGLFDDLSGKGKPLPHKRNPFLAEEEQLAYDLLQDSGHTLPWIDEGHEIDARLEKARQRLQRHYRWYLSERDRRPGHELLALEQIWHGYREEFEREVADINASIRIYNLKITVLALHKNIIILDEEYERLRFSND